MYGFQVNLSYRTSPLFSVREYGYVNGPLLSFDLDGPLPTTGSTCMAKGFPAGSNVALVLGIDPTDQVVNNLQERLLLIPLAALPLGIAAANGTALTKLSLPNIPLIGVRAQGFSMGGSSVLRASKALVIDFLP